MANEVRSYLLQPAKLIQCTNLWRTVACVAAGFTVASHFAAAQDQTRPAPNVTFRAPEGNAATTFGGNQATFNNSGAAISFPATSSSPLRWRSSPTPARSAIEFNVREVQYAEPLSPVEDEEQATVVERQIRRIAFNLQLDSPRNAAHEETLHDTNNSRVRPVGAPGGVTKSVLSGRRPNNNQSSPFADPFGDQRSGSATPAAPPYAAEAPSQSSPRRMADEEAFAPLTPPQPAADPEDSAPMPPVSLLQRPRPLEESELLDDGSPVPQKDLTGDNSDRLPARRKRRGCGLYNDRDCCEDESECLRSLDRVKTDTLRMFGRDRLDISPRYKPDADTPEEIQAANERKKQQLALSGEKNWKGRDGRMLAHGQLVDIVEGKALIRGDDQHEVPLKLRELSDDDLCFIAAWYNLPTECTLGNDPFNGRQFVASTFTWQASGLCHKPLYFEEVQLERYGHTAGPLFQPMVSGVHFFTNLAFLPYNMGINPPQECQYALGYYRPGSCAPWMIPPVPLSLRGAASAAGFYTAGAALLP